MNMKSWTTFADNQTESFNFFSYLMNDGKETVPHPKDGTSGVDCIFESPLLGDKQVKHFRLQAILGKKINSNSVQK